MDGAGARADSRYRAFISYSHLDAPFGRMLHRRLESYRIPSRLVGRDTPRGPVPARLAPIFRDREELPAADDLSTEVKNALAASACLIIVCSPHARASPWVAREIEVFRELHGESRPVLAALIEGEPADSFPEPIHRAGPGGARREPIAADFRKEGDGERLALLKLVAGLTGLDLDALVQRDAQRQVRRVTAVTLGTLAALLMTGLLLVMALNARREADRQRAEAEGLIEFMLTDLRDRLKGVGSIAIMDEVNARALGYYGKQSDLDDLSADSLQRRARILHAMGEDDMSRHNRGPARRKFLEAHRVTAALVAKAPRDPKSIFAHAQSEYWIGYTHYRSGYSSSRLAPAKAHFDAYRRLAKELVAIDPGNADYVRELGYAEGNLCTIALAPPPDGAEALRSCADSVELMRRASAGAPSDSHVESSLANRHAWLADAFKVNGELGRAFAERREEGRLIDRIRRRDPENRDFIDQWLSHQRGLAELETMSGNRAAALARLTAAFPVSQELIRFEPNNRDWIKRRRELQEAWEKAGGN